jgi:hypothetical protein
MSKRQSTGAAISDGNPKRQKTSKDSVHGTYQLLLVLRDLIRLGSVLASAVPTMTWGTLVVLSMLETGGPVNTHVVREWIRSNCPSRYEKSFQIAAVFHTPTHLNRTWALVEKGTFKLLKPPEDVSALRDMLKQYNDHQALRLGANGGLPTPPPSISVHSARSMDQGRRKSSSSESGASLLVKPQLSRQPMSPYSPHSPLTSPSSPADVSSTTGSAIVDFAASGGNAQQPGVGPRPKAIEEAVGRAHHPAAHPLVFSKQVLDESCAAWVMERRCKKRTVVSPEEYRQPLDKAIAFILSLGE